MTFGRITFGGTSRTILFDLRCARRANFDAGRLGAGTPASVGFANQARSVFGGGVGAADRCGLLSLSSAIDGTDCGGLETFEAAR